MHINPLKIEKRQIHINPLNGGSIYFFLPLSSAYVLIYTHTQKDRQTDRQTDTRDTIAYDFFNTVFTFLRNNNGGSLIFRNFYLMNSQTFPISFLPW